MYITKYTKIETPEIKAKVFGIDCIEENGQLSFNAAQTAMALGFTVVTNGRVYIQWARLESYFYSIGITDRFERTGFISTKIFFKVILKAKNDFANRIKEALSNSITPEILEATRIKFDNNDNNTITND